MTKEDPRTYCKACDAQLTAAEMRRLISNFGRCSKCWREMQTTPFVVKEDQS